MAWPMPTQIKRTAGALSRVAMAMPAGNKLAGTVEIALSAPCLVIYRNRSAICELELGDEWRVSLQENLLQSLARTLRGGECQSDLLMMLA